VALSFPFFNGWDNWTPAEVAAAVATSGCVVQSLWEDWPAVKSSEHAEVYNVNVRRPILSSCKADVVADVLQSQSLLVCHRPSLQMRLLQVPLGRREDTGSTQEVRQTTVCKTSQYTSLYGELLLCPCRSDAAPIGGWSSLTHALVLCRAG